MKPRISFHGAAGEVTGSCFLIEWSGGKGVGTRKALVDCGLYQGSKSLKELNYRPFPFNPTEIDAVLVTHAHIDHSGLLPKLVHYGYAGPIHTTEGTRDLLSFMLADSAYIQEMEVERLNRRNARRGRDRVDPIYTGKDADNTLPLIRTCGFEEWVDIGFGLRARWWNAGHILGAGSIELLIPDGSGGHQHVLFSGDIGPDHKSFHADPDAPEGLDYVIMESTYGDRVRENPEPKVRRAMLEKIVRNAMKRGGILLIPAFAVERTQELLFDLLVLMKEGELKRVPIFIDSPLATRATRVFCDHSEEFDERHDFARLIESSNVRFTRNVDESKALAKLTGGAIIMAASGMCDAGRIRYHLKNHLWKRETTVLIAGFQAQGTLGAILAEGTSDTVRIHGETIAVAADIQKLDVYSGHADRNGLVQWLKDRMPVRKGIFLVHGEEMARAGLFKALLDAGIDQKLISLPVLDETVTLGEPIPVYPEVKASRLPEADKAGRDWHNDYAAFLIDLEKRLRSAKDEKTRETLIQRVRKELDRNGFS